MPGNGDSDRRSLGELLRDLVERSAQLVRQEARLARTELANLVRGVGTGTAAVAGGGVLALLGVIALVAGLIMLIGDQWVRDRYWLAALIVTVVLGVIAAILARMGLALLSPERLVPDETIATLKEDSAWVKRQLTSDATSS